MKTVVVTGANGFIGKNLCASLNLDENIRILTFTRDNTEDELRDFLNQADFVFHLAGSNRPTDDSEFKTVNTELTGKIVEILEISAKKAPVLLTSSIQAELDNPYGKSKKAGEALLRESSLPHYIYRLPNVFGKWCKPNYNSVIATFCHNISHDLPVTVNDPSYEMTLVYIDEVVTEFIKAMNGKVVKDQDGFCPTPQTYQSTVGRIKDTLEAFKKSRETLIMPNLEANLDRFLYATFTSYFAEDCFDYELIKNSDERGWLTEFIKSRQFGQVFISRTKPGISRGNHWHHTKIEKFLVIDGEAEISFRRVGAGKEDIIRYSVTGDNPRVLDIPAGYVHAIKNTGSTDLTTIFWADEILDQQRPDTFYEEV